MIVLDRLTFSGMNLLPFRLLFYLSWLWIQVRILSKIIKTENKLLKKEAGSCLSAGQSLTFEGGQG